MNATPPSQQMGSLQPNKIAAPYDFSIKKVLGEAWRRVNGMKASVWAAIVLIYLVNMGCGFLFYVVQHLPAPLSVLMMIIVYIIILLIELSLQVGLYFLGVRRAVDLPVRAKSIFSFLPFMGQFFALFLMQNVLIGIAGIFLVLSVVLPASIISVLLQILFIFISLYIILSFMFAYFLVVEKKLGIFEAYKASFYAFSQHWFKITATLFLMGIILLASAIPFFLGLIWTVPMGINLIGILYRQAFGVEDARIKQ